MGTCSLAQVDGAESGCLTLREVHEIAELSVAELEQVGSIMKLRKSSEWSILRDVYDAGRAV